MKFNILSKAFAGVVLVMSFATVSAAQDTIRIGSVLSVTGAASYIGDPEAKTLKLYVDKVNDSGGILGKKLELVLYDDASDANKARTFSTRLVERDEIVALVGGSTTGTTMAMVPVMERAKIPFMSLAGSVRIIEPVKKYVFKSPHTDRMACQRVFQDMNKRGISKIALIAGTDGFGLSMHEQCLKVIGNYGIQAVMDETYGAQDTDMTPQLAKIKANKEVQAIFNTGASGQGPAILTRNYGQLGMQSIPMYQNNGVASKAYIELSGSASEGVRLPVPALLVASQLPDSDPQKKVLVGYISAYETAFKEPVSAFGGGAYDGLMMTIDAIKSAGSEEPEKIRKTLESTGGFLGTAGLVNMSKDDHMGLTTKAFKLVEVKNGDWRLIND